MKIKFWSAAIPGQRHTDKIYIFLQFFITGYFVLAKKTSGKDIQTGISVDQVYDRVHEFLIRSYPQLEYSDRKNN